MQPTQHQKHKIGGGIKGVHLLPLSPLFISKPCRRSWPWVAISQLLPFCLPGDEPWGFYFLSVANGGSCLYSGCMSLAAVLFGMRMVLDQRSWGLGYTPSQRSLESGPASGLSSPIPIRPSLHPLFLGKTSLDIANVFNRTGHHVYTASQTRQVK